LTIVNNSATPQGEVLVIKRPAATSSDPATRRQLAAARRAIASLPPGTFGAGEYTRISHALCHANAQLNAQHVSASDARSRNP
jgi:hypothetical protein